MAEDGIILQRSDVNAIATAVRRVNASSSVRQERSLGEAVNGASLRTTTVPIYNNTADDLDMFDVVYLSSRVTTQNIRGVDPAVSSDTHIDDALKNMRIVWEASEPPCSRFSDGIIGIMSTPAKKHEVGSAIVEGPAKCRLTNVFQKDASRLGSNPRAWAWAYPIFANDFASISFRRTLQTGPWGMYPVLYSSGDFNLGVPAGTSTYSTTMGVVVLSPITARHTPSFWARITSFNGSSYEWEAVRYEDGEWVNDESIIEQGDYLFNRLFEINGLENVEAGTIVRVYVELRGGLYWHLVFDASSSLPDGEGQYKVLQLNSDDEWVVDYPRFHPASP